MCDSSGTFLPANAVMTARINDQEVLVMIDSRNFLCYINKKTAFLLDLNAESCETDVLLNISNPIY